MGEVGVPVQGMTTDNQTPLYKGSTAVLLSVGNVKYDQTNIVEFDTVTCAVSLTEIDQFAALNLTDTDEGYVGVNILNGVSELRGWSRDGQPTGAADYDGVDVPVSVAAGSKL